MNRETTRRAYPIPRWSAQSVSTADWRSTGHSRISKLKQPTFISINSCSNPFSMPLSRSELETAAHTACATLDVNEREQIVRFRLKQGVRETNGRSIVPIED